MTLASVALAALLMGGCATRDAGAPFELTLLHVNDHHSRLDEEGLTLRLQNAAGVRENVSLALGGFPRVTAAMAALAQGKPNVVKLHAGDAITGDLYFNLDEGKADAALMNTVCFDAFAAGNHEFDNGDAGLRRFIDDLHAGPCKTPVLSANLKPAARSALGTDHAFVKPSTVIERGGERIGIVGLTIAGKTMNSSRPDPGTTFEDEAVAAQREIDALRARGINKIILLTHITYEGDKALAARLSGVDVIVGGDSHSLLGPDSLRDLGLRPEGPYPTLTTDRDGRRVCIVQAWQYSFAVGELRVRFDANGDLIDCPGQPHLLVGESLRRRGGPVTGSDAQAMRAQIAAIPALRVTQPAAAAVAVLAPFKAARDAFARTPAGRSADNLCLRRIPGTLRDPDRSALGDACNKDARVIAHGGDIQQAVAQAYLEHGQAFGGADIALLNAGAIRVDIAAGDVTVGRVYTLLPFKNTLVRLSMTGAEIHAALEDALAFVLGGPSNTGAYPYAAGLRFDVDLRQPRGSRASQLHVRNAQGVWVPLDINARYRLITINFLAEGGDGFATLKKITGPRREDTYLDYADAFLRYVKARTPLSRVPVTDYSTRQFIDAP